MTEPNSTPSASATPPFEPSARVAGELALPLAGVRATIKLLAEGATVPFIARYRKEVTGALDEVQIRAIDEKRVYYTEVHERRVAILAEIEKQGRLTDELKRKIEAAWVKSELEDLYLPYKPKRRTRAMIARERGLEPLALRILAQPGEGDPEAEAAPFVDPEKGLADAKAVRAGARDIVAEIVAERADVRAVVREAFQATGVVKVERVEEKSKEPTKFEAYYGFEEAVKTIPSHRYLAIRRGETDGVLRARITVEQEPLERRLEAMAGVRSESPFASDYALAVRDALTRLLLPSIENDVRVDLKMQADRAAVGVFAENLEKLLLAAPLGGKTVIGIDPGQRTGCKCVVVDETGKLLDHKLIQLVQGDMALTHAKRTLTELVQTHKPYAIAVGNGTHGRETADFCRELLKTLGMTDSVLVVPVSESGASVYSASDVAREEFPDLDLTVRGAISIARRLQDPLAELVKIDPKAIGVGQYQHDVFPSLLKRKLEEVVEHCVNAVGVELNTASAPLLSYVAGVGPTLAKRIVQHRNETGPFRSRKALLDVPGMGPRTFEQCAGFVRVRGGEHPLDSSAVHPERYGLVERIAADAGVGVDALVGNDEALKRVPWSRYVSEDVGELTLDDIQSELRKPGRDPRSSFEPPSFRDDVREMTDLKVGMELEGIVTNVTAFGAFVDVGVHQDGLVHVSQLADRFVKDPHEVAKVGDKLKVRVLEVDLARKRISLSARSGAAAAPRDGGTPARGPAGSPRGDRHGGDRNPRGPKPAGGGMGRSAVGTTTEAQLAKFSNMPFAQLKALSEKSSQKR